MPYIVARPLGGRRYQYWYSSSPYWREDVFRAYRFDDKSAAENYIQEHLTSKGGSFEQGDFARPFDEAIFMRQCQFCLSHHVQTEHTDVEHPKVVLSMVCNGCNRRWKTTYAYNSRELLS